jgi:hypothetical protein
MATMRHWKQRFDVGAKLVFRKKMKLGICGVEVVEKGDPVTEAMKQVLGRNRLRMWWNSNILEITDFVDPAETSRKRKAAEKEAESSTEETSGGEVPRMEHTGSGWYDVIFVDRTERIRGKKNAEALMNGDGA